MDVLVEFLEAGRTESIGVSGVRATTLRTLAAEYPISFVQNRQNLRTGPDADVVTVCREFEITYIAYEPLGVGGRKQALLDIATGQGLSLQQLAIRWALSQDVLPIPGSSQPDHVADWAATEWRPLEKAVLDAVSAVTEKMVTEPEEARDG